VLEAALVIVVLAIAIMGTQVQQDLVFVRVTPQNLAIVIAWGAGIWLQKKVGSNLPWHAQGKAPDAQKEPPGHARQKKDQKAGKTSAVVTKFGIACVLTLAAGVALELAGDHIADKIGMSGVLFGATFLAASTAIPEISTGITAVRMGDYEMAESDIFGGQCFPPGAFPAR
jgi:cation:H+ antiporter